MQFSYLQRKEGIPLGSWLRWIVRLESYPPERGPRPGRCLDLLQSPDGSRRIGLQSRKQFPLQEEHFHLITYRKFCAKILLFKKES